MAFLVDSPPEKQTRREQERWLNPRRMHRRHQREVWISATVLAVLTLGCFVWPAVGHVPSPVHGSILSANLPMWSPGHLFGTDPVGNDIFSRILYGGRVSIEVGLGANVVGLILGSSLGMFSSYVGGLVETVVDSLLEVLLAFPSLVLALVIAGYLGPGELHVIGALSLFTVPAYGRLARALTRRLMGQDFILAARLSGTRTPRVVYAHIAPSVIPQLLTFCSMGLSVTIMLEASLSFLGLGVRLPEPTWGDMIAQGQEYLTTSPHLVLIPSTFLFVTVMSLTSLGDGFRTRLAAR